MEGNPISNKINDTTLNDVYNFWNNESCGERYANGEIDSKKFSKEETIRYKLEPYIKKFANFEQFNDKDVCDIGVGFGCDHSQIARSQPRSLKGIDLTERAIKNTKLRLKYSNLKSDVKIGNAQALSFPDESFDIVYSWGVLHHSPNTQKCFNEVHRVLRTGGYAKIMIYHKYSPTGWMLWIKYGLLKGKLKKDMKTIYAENLESPGTKAYTIKEAQDLTKQFSDSKIKVQLSFSDLLQGDVGARHKGILLSLAKVFYPTFLIKFISSFLPIGLYLLITLKK